MAATEEDLIEVKFRLSDGTDIGPNKYNPATTVASLKEKIITQWPKGYSLYSISSLNDSVWWVFDSGC